VNLDSLETRTQAEIDEEQRQIDSSNRAVGYMMALLLLGFAAVGVYLVAVVMRIAE
jgi:hypothetical protein